MSVGVSRVVAACVVVGLSVVAAISLASAATIAGSNGNDSLVGTSEADVIDAGNGNDVVHAGAGDDTVRGGNGNDQLFGEAGRDELFGDNGNDDLDGGSGSDTGWGANGNDLFVGGDGHDVFDGDNGNDTAQGQAGLDVLFADKGNDQLDGGADADVLAMIATGGSPTLTGGTGRDVIVALGGEVVGGSGDDVIAATGSTNVSAGDGDDTCYRTSGVQVQGCEHVITLGSSSQAASVVVSDAPAEASTILTDHFTYSVAATNAKAVWCVASTGAVVDCTAGSATVTGLENGPQAIAIVAISDGAKVPAVQVRRFTVNATQAIPAIDTATSPAQDTLQVDARALATVTHVRAQFADGGAATWPLTDPRVTVNPPAGPGASQIVIVDPNLGAERITRLELRGAGNTVLATRDLDLPIASSVDMQSASSPAASTLTIEGSGLGIVDRIRLVHAGGVLEVLASDPGVVVTGSQIVITSAALGGLRVSQIDAVIALDGLEVVDSLSVDVSIAASDEVPPAITIPTELTEEAADAAGASVFWIASATDAVDGAVPVTCDPAPGSVFGIGDHVVTCSATDAAGNSATAQLLVHVVDTTAPALDLPEQVVVDAEDASGADVTFDASSNDVVDGVRPVSCTPATGSRFSIGSTVVTCSSSDTRGNLASGSFLVVVRDVTPPTLELVSPDRVEIGSADGEPVNFVVRGIDDADGPIDAECDPASGTTFTPGEYVISCSATDAAGNRGEASFTITVVLVDRFTQAEARLAQDLPQVLASSEVQPLPMGTFVQAIDESTLVMDMTDENGDLRRTWVEGNLFTRDASGDLVRIDPTLERDGDVYRPRAVPYQSTLPVRYADGVTWRTPDLGVDVRIVPIGVDAGAADARAVSTQANSLLYPSVWDHVDSVTSATDSRVTEHLVMSDDAASRELRWRIDVPSGAQLELADGGVHLSTSSGEELLVSSPSGFDADGNLVEARYELVGDELSLVWQPTIETEAGTSAARYPIAIDPTFGDVSVGGSFKPTPYYPSGNGIGASCTQNQQQATFEGSRVGTGTRQFQGGPNGVQIGCTFATSKPGFLLAGMRARLSWELTQAQRVSFAEPGTSNAALDDVNLGAQAQKGERFLDWGTIGNGTTGVGVAPRSGARFSMRQAFTSGYGPGKKFSARLDGITRFYYVNIAPTILSFAPQGTMRGVGAAAGAPRWLSAGETTFSMTGIDSGPGCDEDVSGITLYDPANGGLADTDDEFNTVGCNAAGVVDLAPGDEFSARYLLQDLAANRTEFAVDYRVADPLVSPVDGDSIGGLVAIPVEIAQDLGAGSFVVDVVLADGQVQRIASYPVPSAYGERVAVWDSRTVANQAVTIRAGVESNGQLRVLASAAVSVVNVDPLAVHADAASRDVGAGLAVTLATGALQGTTTDARMSGYGGVDLAVGRTFNSLNLDGGVFGPGFASNLDQQLRFDVQGRVVLSDELGLHHAFDRASDGSFLPSASYSGMLSANGDVATAAAEPWIVRFPDGVELRFGPTDASGVAAISRKVWPAGQFVAYEHSMGAGGSQLWHVRDSASPPNELEISVSSDGRATRVEDPLGRATEYAYDAAGRLSTVTDPGGGVVRYSWTADSGMLRSITSANGAEYTVAYDDFATEADVEQPRVQDFTQPQHDPDVPATVVSFDFDEDARTATATEGDREESWTIEPSGGFAATFTDASGEDWSYSHNALGQQTLEHSPDNGDTVSQYNAIGQLELERDAEGHERKYLDLDPNGVPRTIIDEADHETTQVLDTAGRVVAKTGPDGQTWTYGYQDGSSLKTSEVSPLGVETQWAYHPTGQVASEAWFDTDGDPHYRTRNEYDDAGQLVSTRVGTDPATVYQYDDAGRVEQVTDPAGGVTRTEYDVAGQQTKTIDALGKPTTYEYDALGNVVATTDPTGATTRSEYDAHADESATIDAEGRRTTITYDPLGNPAIETDPLDGVTRHFYDAVGNEIKTVDPDLREQTFTYDKLGNETSNTTPGGTEYTSYTPLGDVETETDRAGFVTSYQYDEMGRLQFTTDARYQVTETQYDHDGRVSTTVDPTGRPTMFSYDGGGRRILTVKPDLTTISEDFDDSGRVVRRVDRRGGITTFTYDGAGRKLTETRPDQSEWSWSYDLAGRELTATNGEGETTSVSYDDAGRVASRSTASGATTSFEYRPDGQVWRIHRPTGGIETHTYDDAGRESRVTDEVGNDTDTEYDGAGNRTTMTRGGDTWRWRYNDRGELTRSSRGQSTQEMAYDARGNEVRNEMQTDWFVRRSDYDELGRRTSMVPSFGPTQEWAFDDLGRVASHNYGRNARWQYTYDYATQLPSTEYDFYRRRYTQYQHDAGGSLLTREEGVDGNVMGTETTVHDVSDRVTSFTSFAGRSTQSTYDGAGRVREQDVEQTSGASVHQQRVRDSAGRLVQLDTGHGSIHYTYTVDDRIATRAYPGGRVETFTYDAKGRIASRQLSGENAFLYEYDAQDRVITIRRAPSVHDLAWVEDRYAYDDTGRLATWWHDRDQIRTMYQYDLGHVSRVDRYIDAPVAGQNTPQEDEQVLACLRDITRQVPYNAGSTAEPRLVECPQDVQESLQQRFGTPIPHVGSVDQLQGADLQVARYAVSQPLSIEVNNIYYRPSSDYFDREVYIVTGHNDTMRQPMKVDGVYENVGESLEYDDLGQRTTVQPMTGVDPTRNYTYTAGGQVATATEDGVTQTYTYDNRERLTRVDYSDGRASVLVDYDQQDRIVSLDRYGTTDGDLDMTWDEQGIAAIREHGDTDRTLYPIYNLRGDATAYLDDSGQTIANLAYTPWGQREATGDPIWSSLAILGYQARYASLTLSPHQVWMRGRTYDPELKTFNQTDPANAQQGTGDTAYSYAGNDPVNSIDPDGRDSCKWRAMVLRFVTSSSRLRWSTGFTCTKRNENRYGDAVVIDQTEAACFVGDMNPGSTCATVAYTERTQVLYSVKWGSSAKYSCEHLYRLFVERWYEDPDDLDSVTSIYHKVLDRKAPKCKD